MNERGKDLASTLVVGVGGMLIAFFVCNLLLPEMKDVSFKAVGDVSSQLANPDEEVFNAKALNPTVEIYVGNGQEVQDGATDTILDEDEEAVEEIEEETEEEVEDEEEAEVPQSERDENYIDDETEEEEKEEEE